MLLKVRTMKSVGAFEAKTKLSALLKRVSKGETVQITHRGIPIAVLGPVQPDSRQDTRKAVEEIRAMRKGVKLSGLSLEELISEGRRF
jgi:prevent-host-death family protein